MLSIFPHPIIPFSPQKLFQTNQALSSQIPSQKPSISNFAFTFNSNNSPDFQPIPPLCCPFSLFIYQLAINFQFCRLLPSSQFFTPQATIFFPCSPLSLTQFIANCFPIHLFCTIFVLRLVPFILKNFFQPHLGL